MKICVDRLLALCNHAYMSKQRVMIQLEPEVYNRIRAVSFQTHTAASEVIRQCIEVAIDAVELKLVSGREGKLMMNPEFILRLSELAEEFSRKPKVKAKGTGE